MSEWIEKNGTLYALHTAHTSYLFRVAESGHLQHLYYGVRLPVSDGLEQALTPKTACISGMAIIYSQKYPMLCMDNFRGEVSTEGKGDFGEPFIRLENGCGIRTSDFVLDHIEMPAEKAALSGLPSAYDADAVLVAVLKDADVPALQLEITYAVFADTDVITRSARLINGTEISLTLHKLASAQLDMPDDDYVFTDFHGSWADEMHRCDTVLNGNTAVCESRTGSSSNRANPFTMLARPGANETSGEVYGMNLIYSGSHRTTAQCGPNGRLRWQTGIHPDGLSWNLPAGDSFQAPEAVLCYSDAGYGCLSYRLHRFIRRHVVRGVWRDKQRPVLLNSWEACYFKFDEAKLMKLARAGADCGIELFVMDDGWFGCRDDDKTSLGDWTVNTKKLPHGLAGLADKIEALGMKFGLWVEPEMVNADSELFRAHSDWTLAAPGRSHSEGRNQRILDLCNPEVRAYLKQALGDVFSSAKISYVKWDMNRLFSDAFSPYLGAARQGETMHRYMLGLYDVLEYLTKTYPDILFESCSSGGNRGDLGMLCYMPQFWASDDSDAICRASIQTGYSYGYPLSALGCHVSACPNHQTLRSVPLDTRFNVALCGVLGYEMDFTELSAEDKRAIAAQIALYKQLRPWLQYADYYRTANGVNAPQYAGDAVPVKAGVLPRCRWCAVSADQEHAIAVDLQLLHSVGSRIERYAVPGLAPERLYRFHRDAVPVDIRVFGSLVNTLTPVHVKPGGMLHSMAAQLVHLPGDSEDATLSGAALAHAGVTICPPYIGTGYTEGVKYLPDYGSRLYFADAIPAALPAAESEPDTAEP